MPKRPAAPKKLLTEQQQAIQPLVEQLKDIQPLKEKAEPRRGRLNAAPAPIQAPAEKESEEWIGKWTEDDLVKGIVFSEVFGPPKAKRKK